MLRCADKLERAVEHGLSRFVLGAVVVCEEVNMHLRRSYLGHDDVCEGIIRMGRDIPRVDSSETRNYGIKSTKAEVDHRVADVDRWYGVGCVSLPGCTRAGGGKHNAGLESRIVILNWVPIESGGE